jgi:hypothetical protein
MLSPSLPPVMLSGIGGGAQLYFSLITPHPIPVKNNIFHAPYLRTEPIPALKKLRLVETLRIASFRTLSCRSQCRILGILEFWVTNRYVPGAFDRSEKRLVVLRSCHVAGLSSLHPIAVINIPFIDANLLDLPFRTSSLFNCTLYIAVAVSPLQIFLFGHTCFAYAFFPTDRDKLTVSDQELCSGFQNHFRPAIRGRRQGV